MSFLILFDFSSMYCDILYTDFFVVNKIKKFTNLENKYYDTLYIGLFCHLVFQKIGKRLLDISEKNNFFLPSVFVVLVVLRSSLSEERNSSKLM